MSDVLLAEILAPESASTVVRPVVIVVDDDHLIRAALRRLFVSSGLDVELYPSGAELFARAKFDRPGCLILDLSMPRMNGLEVQECLRNLNVEMPIIFLTGTSDIHIAVTAMRAGAEDFIEKPFDNENLLSRVRHVMTRDCVDRIRKVERQEIIRKMNLLTPRESGVLELIVSGKSSKQVGRILGASHRTIDIHRQHIMQKMIAPSLAELVRMRMLARDELGNRAAEKNERSR